MHATLDDLMWYDGNAELVAGAIVPILPTGFLPNVIAGRLLRRIQDHADRVGRGDAYSVGIGFAVPILSSGRQSFSPSVSYYSGPLPANHMHFLSGPPDFAVEVRSENGYGRAAEAEMAAKRADYFEAGTLVVWDVDPVAGVVCRYTAGETRPTIFAAGDEADAEPAVPGWRVAIDWLMR